MFTSSAVAFLATSAMLESTSRTCTENETQVIAKYFEENTSLLCGDVGLDFLSLPDCMTVIDNQLYDLPFAKNDFTTKCFQFTDTMCSAKENLQLMTFERGTSFAACLDEIDNNKKCKDAPACVKAMKEGKKSMPTCSAKFYAIASKCVPTPTTTPAPTVSSTASVSIGAIAIIIASSAALFF